METRMHCRDKLACRQRKCRGVSGFGDPKRSGGRGQLKSRSDPPTDPFGTHINMYIQLNFYRVC